MKKLLALGLGLGLTLSAVSGSVIAAASLPVDKELLRQVVANQYPPYPPGLSCGDFIPAFLGKELDSRCIAVSKELPSIAFVGDSHVSHFRASLLTHFKKLAPIEIGQTECFPFTADDYQRKDERGTTCGEKQKALLAYLTSAASIETVVLSARWSLLMSGQDFHSGGDGWLKIAGMSAEDKASFIKNGQHFVGSLLKAGKKVVLMRDIPDVDFEIPTCYNVRPVRLGASEIRQDCSMAQMPFEQRRQLQNAVLDEVLKPFPPVKVYDPVPVFCQKGICKASDGTLPYYLNRDHVNNYGAELVFKDFVPKIFPELKN